MTLEIHHVAEMALDYARQTGASEAEVGISLSEGLSVMVRQREVETLEHNNDRGLGVTVYFGHSKASASTSNFSEQAIADTVKAACNIAKHTHPDKAAGLADASLMASSQPDLDLFHPWKLDVQQAVKLATECEQTGLDYDPRIINSEGATLSSHNGRSLYANSHGFIGDTRSSRHSLSCCLIAEDDNGMQREYWYDLKRDPKELSSARYVGLTAAERTVSRLNAGDIKTGTYPVIYTAEAAPALFGQLVAAIRGSALYRKASFLLDKAGKQIFPELIHIHEQPHLLKGIGSAAYDAEGVATRNRNIVQQGVLQGYILDSYAARRLNMQTTANAGGVHNLTIDSTGNADLTALLRQMDKGVMITDTMGMGVNIVNGDYSQGAAGFWVENGQPQYPVDEFTIASNLADMFMGIQAVGSDIDSRGNTRCGSVMIDRMMIASS